MKAIAIFVALIAAANAAVLLHDLEKEEWESFKLRFNKEYKNKKEEGYRMKIFVDNKRKIEEHNKLYEQGLVSFEMGMNQFGDMLHHEFMQNMNAYQRNEESHLKPNESVTYIPPLNVTLPVAIDWRARGAVTRVKNQGYCGSCWAFSATGSLEGQHYRKTGRLVSLSEQNLIDCTKPWGTNGCHGGWMGNAYRYVKDNHGLDTEESYPYKARENQCRYNPARSGATVTGQVDLPEGDENALQNAVANVGPIAVTIDANHTSFRFYKRGLYYEPECNPDHLTHAVLAVGYGRDYWLVKNSWRTTWGNRGYIKMARNRNNNCGIASAALYPLV